MALVQNALGEEIWDKKSPNLKKNNIGKMHIELILRLWGENVNLTNCQICERGTKIQLIPILFTSKYRKVES